MSKSGGNGREADQIARKILGGLVGWGDGGCSTRSTFGNGCRNGARGSWKQLKTLRLRKRFVVVFCRV